MLTYKLTLTLDSKADELLKGYDGFKNRMHLRTPDGTTRGNVLFDDRFRTVRIDTYEENGKQMIKISRGSVTYENHTFAEEKDQQQKREDGQTDKAISLIKGKKDGVLLRGVFNSTKKIARSLMRGQPMDYRLPQNTYKALVDIINSPETRIS